MKREGQISVNSKNMFPIIKKWLYSDKDIFLREIVSNSCDAIKKLISLRGIGQAPQEDGYQPRVEVRIDSEKKQLTMCIRDRLSPAYITGQANTGEVQVVVSENR